MAKRRSAKKGVLDWWQTVLDETKDLVDDSIDIASKQKGDKGGGTDYYFLKGTAINAISLEKAWKHRRRGSRGRTGDLVANKVLRRVDSYIRSINDGYRRFTKHHPNHFHRRAIVPDGANDRCSIS